MDKTNTTVMLVTFGLFMSEALLHYNLGAHKDPSETKKFVLPPANDFVKLAVIVGVFSVLNGVIISQITKSNKII